MKQGNNITLKKHLLFVLLSLWLVSCYNDNPVIVDPIPEQEESPSAKDNQPWPLTQYMDAANYRPGDDFFMYCNGCYWKNTSLGDNQLICGFLTTEMEEALNQLSAGISSPAYEQLKAHQNVQFTNDQFYAFLKPYFDKIDGIQSYEDAFRVAGELKRKGLNNLLKFSVSSTKIIKLSINAEIPYGLEEECKAYMGDDHPESIYKYYEDHQLKETRYVSPFGYWLEHKEEYEEAKDKAKRMVTQYLLPALDMKETDINETLSFEGWFLSSLDILKAFMKMSVFKDYVYYANEQSLHFINSYYKTETKPYEQGLEATSALKKYLDGRTMIERYVSPQVKSEVETQCEEMRQTFIDRIGRLTWMSSTTKDNAIRKIRAIKFFVGYPDRWLVDTPDLSQNTNMLEDMQQLMKAGNDMYINALGIERRNDAFNFGAMLIRPEALMDPQAYYEESSNIIVINAPYLLPHMYDTTMHPAMKYGLLLSTIGHELTHAVDSSGSKSDENGNEADWWTEPDRTAYEVLQKRLVELYNGITPIPDDPTLSSDGERTLDENIADLGGTEIGHDAFVAYCVKQGFKGEDLDEMERKYFQACAEYFRSKYGLEYYELLRKDVHAFPSARVNGVMMNIDRWYELYNVKEGDKLYLKPESRIHIW